MSATKLPPSNEPAERSVLGAMLVSNDAIAAVRAEIGADAFYKPTNQLIAAAIFSCHDRGEPADSITVAAELARTGHGSVTIEELHELQNTTPSISNSGQHARLVRGASDARRLIAIGADITATGSSVNGDGTHTIALADARRHLERIELRAVTSRHSVDEAWARVAAGTNPAPEPTLLARTDGRGLIHDEATVLMFGPSGAGKTKLVQRAVTTGTALGQHVAWLDLCRPTQLGTYSTVTPLTSEVPVNR